MSAIENIEAAARAGGVPIDQARPPMRAGEYLTFRMGSEEYGIDILKVQEIRGYGSPTHILGAPDFIKGVIDLRGVIVPIVDLRMKFGMADVRYDEFTVVVILNVAGRVVGAVVDSVSDVIELDESKVHPAPELNGAMDSNVITGLGCVKHGDGERMLILLDIERLIASRDLGLVEPPLQ